LSDHHHLHVHDRRFIFDKVAKLDSPKRYEHMPPAPLVKLVADMAPAAVLDIGVGTGYLAIPLAAALPDADIVGADVEPRMFEVLAEHAAKAGVAGRVTTVQVPADRLELPRGDFDVALLVAIYHELDDRVSYLAGVRQTLAPGGRVVICDWRPEDEPEHGPPNSHRLAEETAVAELTSAGFDQVESLELYPSLYVLVGRSGGSWVKMKP
jgi:ubiquinone/menaquinone biosynthesis C-methylase UbiE